MARIKHVLKHHSLPEDELQQVWDSYRAEGGEHLRNKLMEHYLPLVRFNADRIHTKLPEEVDVEDLVSAGIFGLMDALDAYDPERGVKFETYCAPRIRGAILDELLDNIDSSDQFAVNVDLRETQRKRSKLELTHA